MKHVLMTANGAWNVWHFRRPIVAALLGDDTRVTVLAPPDESVSDLVEMGCRFIPLPMELKGLNPFRDFQLFQHLNRTFRLEEPEVVLSYTIKNNIFGAMAARRRDVPFIPNVTGLGTAFLSSRTIMLIAEQLYRRAFRELPVIFFQNSDDRDLFVERRIVALGQTQVLPGSGVDLHRFAATDYPVQSDAPVFLMIARLLRDKGVLEFIEAARRIKSQLPDVRFQLLGAIESHNRSAIEAKRVHEWQREGVVEYLGQATDVRPHIAAAHCVVLPSYREGAPRTLMEAAAMARPLIATNVPGCRLIIENNINGLLCDPHNAESLALAYMRFMHLPYHARVQMGLAGRIKMESEFDERFVVDAYRSALKPLSVCG